MKGEHGMIDWKRKLTSRKLWVAIAGFVSGLILAFGGAAETAETVSGVILSAASVVGYMVGEGLADAGNGGIILEELEVAEAYEPEGDGE